MRTTHSAIKTAAGGILYGNRTEKEFTNLWLLTLHAYPWEGVEKHVVNMYYHTGTLEAQAAKRGQLREHPDSARPGTPASD